jgi:hypothetical protein
MLGSSVQSQFSRRRPATGFNVVFFRATHKAEGVETVSADVSSKLGPVLHGRKVTFVSEL